MTTTKTRLVTMAMMEKAILPRIEEIINERAEKTEAKIEEHIKKYRNEVIEFKDEVMGKVKSFEEEAMVSTYQNQRIEKRVERIEKHLSLSPVE